DEEAERFFLLPTRSAADSERQHQCSEKRRRSSHGGLAWHPTINRVPSVRRGKAMRTTSQKVGKSRFDIWTAAKGTRSKAVPVRAKAYFPEGNPKPLDREKGAAQNAASRRPRKNQFLRHTDYKE